MSTAWNCEDQLTSVYLKQSKANTIIYLSILCDSQVATFQVSEQIPAFTLDDDDDDCCYYYYYMAGLL